MSHWLRVVRSQHITLPFRNDALLITRPYPPLVSSAHPSLLGTRHASSKKSKNKDQETGTKELKGKVVSTASLIPGSKQPITDAAALEQYARAETTMRTALDWFRKECAAAESRASGRVTPALLAPVRVKLPGTNDVVKLEQVATVGVRDGTTLIVTMFDETSIKQVEQSIYEAKIPHVVPQKYDNRTIKVPIPRPTVEARLAEYTTQQRKAEDIRVQIRKAFQTSVKRGKYEKHSIELSEFQRLSDRYIHEVDQILVSLKKATSSK